MVGKKFNDHWGQHKRRAFARSKISLHINESHSCETPRPVANSTGIPPCKTTASTWASGSNESTIS